jgi:hypothetical protein
MYMRGANGVMLCFSVTDRDSFDRLHEWLSLIRENCPRDVPILLVGTKVDRVDKRVILLEDAEGFAAGHGWPYVEVSSVTGEGVHEAFGMMTDLVAAPPPPPRFSLLWRGSRDGFAARDFHRRCDGKSPTLTVIRDRRGNVFGGFTGAARQSPRTFSRLRGNPSEQSFLFTVNNPHNLAGRIFRLKSAKVNSAIRISSRLGPSFGDDDLVICDGCDVKESHAGGFGSSYENDSGLDGRLLLTGSTKFKVSEIEVFSYTFSSNE